MQLNIEIKSLSYQDKTLLQDCNLQVEKGEKILLIGATGSGKTSLLHTLNLMNPHYEGIIRFNGANIKDYRPEELRQRIMEVMQEPWLDDMSVLDVLKEPWQYKIHHKTAKAHIHSTKWMEEIESLLNAFALDKSYLKAKTSQLSGGEKQRIALIRSLQFHPEILLLDEISSALDQKTSAIISSCLLHNYKWTIIAISHDPLWQDLWQKVWDFRDKKILVQDKPAMRGK